MLTTERKVYTITQLNQHARALLEDNFPSIWVEGEISNLARPASGHIYFSLKDQDAQVRCAMFRMKNRLVNFAPENGTQVLVRAKASLYAGRGDYQLIVDSMEEAGDGALRRQFELLKSKLTELGLFKAEHKKELPALPSCVGVVTSSTGAALHDILSVLERRFPGINVIVYPSEVQGKTAAANIAKQIDIANRRNECDVLIVGRGGGSLEDLWAFNEEVVAHAIFDSTLPIVSAVGHEVDFTIADFVADVRAPTPSAAAELISPDREEWLQAFARQQQRLVTHLLQNIRLQQQHLMHLSKRLQHPGRRLQEQTQRLDQCQLQLERAWRQVLRRHQHDIERLSVQLQQHNPTNKINQLQTETRALAHSLHQLMQQKCTVAKQELANVARALDAVSPLATLQRGYSVASSADGHIITSTSQLSPGERIHTRLADGSVTSVIAEIG